MKQIILSRRTWHKIRELLQEEYAKSVFMLRSRMRERLGFTVRDHKHYDNSLGYYVEQVHLDFYSENKRTMFLLKFSEFINRAEQVIE
jgi:siroheme synthase (precorrin-2 oxidase/ferrochelatase)